MTRVAYRFRRAFSMALAACVFSIVAFAQNQNQTQGQNQSQGQSLADIARQQKEKKQQQQKKPTTRVYNDDNIASGHSGSGLSTTGDSSSATNDTSTASSDKQGADQWRANIKQQKQMITSLQEQTDKLKASVHYVVADAYANSGQAVQYNQAQKRNQDQAERMQQQLDSEKKKLEDMQDACRKQGYGSNVCDAS